MPYGVLHNNFYYFYYPEKADGTKSKTAYVKQIWVPLDMGNDRCIAFETEERAIEIAQDQYYNDRSWKVVELDENGEIIVTPEIEKLQLGYRPTRADEGERVD